MTPKLIYTIATHHLPTAAVLSVERRERMLALAAAQETLILEDNVFHCFRYGDDPPPTLLSLDREGLVLQSDSFTKSVAPSTGVGWMAGSPEAIVSLATMRQDLGTSQWLCRTMAQYLAGGLFERHIEETNDLYRAKRDAVERGLKRHCSDWVSFLVPAGGVYFWLELSDRIDWDGLEEAAAERGIAIGELERVPGSSDGAPHLRMAFAQLQMTAAEIEAQMQEFGEALESVAARSEGRGA